MVCSHPVMRTYVTGTIFEGILIPRQSEYRIGLSSFGTITSRVANARVHVPLSFVGQQLLSNSHIVAATGPFLYICISA